MLTIFLIITILGLIISIAWKVLKLEGNFGNTIKYWGIAAAVALFFNLTLNIVGGQEVGVIVTPGGVSSDELTPGWNFVGPWNRVYYMDKTAWVYSFTNNKIEGAKPSADAIWCPTKDGIKMGFDASLSWKIDPTQASWIFENVSEQDGPVEARYQWIEENIIRPAVKSKMPLVVSKFTPIECYSYKRQEIQDEVNKTLQEELRKTFKLIVIKFDIREVFYNREYEQAINNKKLAEQEALRLVDVTKQKEELLKQEQINKDIVIAKAEGESRALQIKGQSISNNPKIIQLEWINAWKEGGSQVPKIIGTNNSMFMLDVNSF